MGANRRVASLSSRHLEDQGVSADDEDDAMFKLTINQRLGIAIPTTTSMGTTVNSSSIQQTGGGTEDGAQKRDEGAASGGSLPQPANIDQHDTSGGVSPRKKRTLINNCSANVNPSPSPEQPKNRNSAFASGSPLNRFDSGQRYQPPIVAAVPVNRKSAVTAGSGGTGGEKARNSNALRLVAATTAEVSISPRQEAEDAVASDDESARSGAAQGTQQFVNVEIGFENSAAEGATAFASVGGLAPIIQSEMAEAGLATNSILFQFAFCKKIIDLRYCSLSFLPETT